MALIFDLDGTLVDSYTIMVKQLHGILSSFAPYKEEEIRKAILETSIVDYIIKQVKTHGLDVNHIKTAYLSQQAATQPADYPLMPGVKETLMTLSQTHDLFIFTHRGATIHDILKAHGIDHLFKAVITSDDGFDRKPSPQALNFLVATHHLKAADSYYIGDRSLDIESGMNAGLKTIYLGEGIKDHKEANFCINHFTDLLDLRL